MEMDTGPRTAAPMQWEFIDALGDGIYGVDHAGICTFVNKAAVRLLGYERAEELIGRNMHAAIHHTRPDGSPYPQAECPLLHVASSGHAVRLENEMLWRKDGTPFLAEYSSFPVVSGGHSSGSVITFTDTSTRQDARTRLAVEHTVSQILAGAGTQDLLAARILEAIGIGLSWDIGLFWRMEPGAGGDTVLRCLARWRSEPGQDGVGLDADAFLAASAGMAFGAGEGLPGRSWAAGEPCHVAELGREMAGPRHAEAVRAGLNSAFAFPIADGAAVVGAIEFYSRQHIATDDSLLEAVTTLGHQIGQAFARRSAAEALADSERLKAAILATSPDCIISVDEHGRIVEFNQTAEQAFGRFAADMAGRDLATAIFPPDAQAAHRRAFASTLEGGTTMGRTMETEVLREDGSRFPAEIAMTRIEGARRALVTIYLRDLTARRRQQDRLRDSETRFRTIANGIPQLAWMTDSTGAVTWYNQRWFDYTGTNYADMLGWGWRSVHHPDHVDRVERKLRDSVSNGADWEDTFPLRAQDGGYRWFLSRAVPIRDEGGPIIGWFGTNTDITEMREAEHALAVARDEAEAANRAKSTFMANMSHELRTPLSAIIGYAELLREEMEDGAEAAELAADMQKIEGNARHLLGLINDVLDLSKVESGKMEAFAETFDVAAMVGEIAATVDTLVQRNENRLDVTLVGDLGRMHSDVTRVRQVLLNLLSNAAKFTDHGTITLRVERSQVGGVDWLAFAVTDTGIGMTAEQLDKLFRRFQQADASTTRQFGGTGLGLALTKGFAELLGGTIAVSSTLGQGSTFTCRLPAVLAGTPDAAGVAAAAGAAAGQDTVLVIDDDAAQRELIGRFLKREGYAAAEAADGSAGLELARQLQPWAILLDVTMPGLDGWSVLSALKADEQTAGIPVVMVTFSSERGLAASLGAADYVMKPIDWERLRAVMERFRDDPGDVLVIDDDAGMRERTRRSLEKNGWSVTEAAHGLEALALVERAVPRVVLLDLDMPVMNGFEFLPAFRARPGCGAVPVVVITALELTAENRAQLRGASQVLRKDDVDLPDLAETLKGLLRARKALG